MDLSEDNFERSFPAFICVSLCGYAAMIRSPDTVLDGSTGGRGPPLDPGSYLIQKQFLTVSISRLLKVLLKLE